MAIPITHEKVLGKAVVRATLLDDVGATSNGEWINVQGIHPYSIHVSGITTATVQIRISNKLTKPADTDHEIQAGSNITANGITEYTAPVRWIKARVSAWTAGTIRAEYVHNSN